MGLPLIKDKGFSLTLIKRFAIQILISLYYMREHNIVHCDLKPENILLEPDLDYEKMKIIDFGSGCFEGRIAEIIRAVLRGRYREIIVLE
jgi:serine/threonine protein kinase